MKIIRNSSHINVDVGDADVIRRQSSEHVKLQNATKLMKHVANSKSILFQRRPFTTATHEQYLESPRILVQTIGAYSYV